MFFALFMLSLLSFGPTKNQTDSVQIASDTVRVYVENDTTSVTLFKGQRVEWLSSTDDHFVCDYNGQRLIIPRVNGIVVQQGKALTKSPESTTTKSSSGGTTSTQCTGTTKSGNRCKRMTNSSSGRCWQH